MLCEKKNYTCRISTTSNARKLTKTEIRKGGSTLNFEWTNLAEVRTASELKKIMGLNSCGLKSWLDISDRKWRLKSETEGGFFSSK